MTPAEISAHLEKVLSNPLFSRSARLSRFLRFVVEAAQAGQTDSVKEYLIGVEVFDRGRDFDPRIDPIVRVQAAKLRSKLLEYYASSGAQDGIVISMPKGSYAPEIRDRKPTVAGAASKVAPERSRIAVMPFTNISPDPENEYFSDGLTEEVINRLACIPGLQVVARTSAFRFKGHNEDLREVGAKLNVGTVMEGSVRKAGDQLRVTAQLIDVQSGYHLFSQTYQREYKNVFELQDELAQAVADEVLPWTGGSRPVVVTTRATNLDAYNAYLRGMYAIANRFADLPQTVNYFREAIKLDPTYAPAWAGVAQSHFLLAYFYMMPAEQAMSICKEAALRTLEIDANCAQGHSSLGLVECAFEWLWSCGEARFHRAVELQPGFALMYALFAYCCLLPQGRREEACRAVERSLSLDPFNPLSQCAATFIYGSVGRYQDAIRQHILARDLNPYFPPVMGTIGLSHEWNGHLDRAIEAYWKTYELAPNTPLSLSVLGHALAIKGEHGQAEQFLNRLAAFPSPPHVDIAIVYLGLHNEEETLHWLEKAVEHRNFHLITVPSDHRFDWIRPNPRFQNLLQNMGLQAVARTTA